MSYEKLGLKCGIEIHQQLEGEKLFCSCPTTIQEKEADFIIRRKLRASAGESGEIDVAARQEQLRGETFVYAGYDTTCLVECDEEPPHELNNDALYTSLQFCSLVKGDVSPVVQVMRKTVVDGSNTSGFQRTALIARGGKIETEEGEVRLANISLEEDSCKIVSENEDSKTYRLDRLGIPLIEIGTEPDIRSPTQCLQAAQKLGMFLRSLPGVKRGLGTIRQDVNVSIHGGTRIEIKGAQELKQLPMLVELEVKRQAELVKLKDELRGVRLNEFNLVELTVLLQDCESERIQKASSVLGIKLHGLAGMIGRELQPGYRVGTELSGRAKRKAGVGGIFHSDELPAYGISESDVKKIRKKLNCTPTDAFIMVAADTERATRALEAVYERVTELFTGVPPEVRKANADGTTTYLRPIPGAARMYPETDVPLLRPTTDVELPELLDAKIKRFRDEYNLSIDLAEFVVKKNPELFEKFVGKYRDIKPAFIADVLTAMPVEIKRKYELDSDVLTETNFDDVFKYLAAEMIHKDIVLDVLIDMIKGSFTVEKYKGLSTEEIHAVIKDIVSRNKDAPFGALMGQCMKALAGKASGQVISQELKKIVEG